MRIVHELKHFLIQAQLFVKIFRRSFPTERVDEIRFRRSIFDGSPTSDGRPHSTRRHKSSQEKRISEDAARKIQVLSKGWKIQLLLKG